MTYLTADTWTSLNDSKVQTALQVLTVQKTDTQYISSTAWVNVMGLTITPRYATSKILLIVKCSFSLSNSHSMLRIVRNNNLIAAGDAAGSRIRCFNAAYGTGTYGTAGYEPRNFSSHWVDSPNSTSSQEYIVQAASPYSGSYVIGINYNVHDDADATYTYRTSSSFTLMEISQ